MDVIIYMFALPEMYLSYDISLDRYKYETTIKQFSEVNDTESVFPCLSNGSHSQDDESSTTESQAGETATLSNQNIL